MTASEGWGTITGPDERRYRVFDADGGGAWVLLVPVSEPAEPERVECETCRGARVVMNESPYGRRPSVRRCPACTQEDKPFEVDPFGSGDVSWD